MQSVPQPQAPPTRRPMTVPDLIALPATLLERFARVGVDVDAVLRRAEIPRSRFSVAKPEGTTAEFFALWRAAEESGGTDLGLRLGIDTLLDEAALALPLVTHNAQLLAVLVPGLESALAQAGRTPTLADDVRTALSQKICGERPAVEKVAKALGMSPRTLQRRLGELGTTYQQLLDDVRRRSARRLLASTDLGTAEVAFLLGFEELNSFTRAFHSWEGTTPVRWRATAR